MTDYLENMEQQKLTAPPTEEIPAMAPELCDDGEGISSETEEKTKRRTCRKKAEPEETVLTEETEQSDLQKERAGCHSVPRPKF